MCACDKSTIAADITCRSQVAVTHGCSLKGCCCAVLCPVRYDKYEEKHDDYDKYSKDDKSEK